MIERFRHAPPKAAAMIEALRGIGYSTATALADIIDNSIAAQAKHIEIFFHWAGRNSRVSVIDDGDGMDAVQLDKAMRLGEKSPLDARAANDLGRFGLGLKTASFSQCRCLTVSSLKGGSLSTLRWDLDVLAQTNDNGWRLLEGPTPGSENFLSPLQKMEKGTLVLWEKLDRIITPGFSEQDFLDLIDVVERHMAMVFHRFISRLRDNLCLTINGKSVVPWDPFLTSHAATWSSPVEKIACEGGTAEVQCFVLPHKDRLDTGTFEKAAGPDGWTSQQGFYVYRNERLLVAGGWLGLGHGRHWTREEPHRLARIRLDIPNSADAEWKIDIRKSIARPPVSIRAKLIRLAEDVRMRARRIFAHRGQIVSNKKESLRQAWISEKFSGGIRYHLDENHPAIRAVLDTAGESLPYVKAMLRVIEETVPVQRIWLDTVEEKETPRTGFSAQPQEQVEEVLHILFNDMTERRGMMSSRAKQVLLQTEPFQNYPALIAILPDD